MVYLKQQQLAIRTVHLLYAILMLATGGNDEKK